MNLSERLKRLPYTPLQIAVHVYVWASWRDRLRPSHRQLAANPLQAIQQRTGRLAITLLVLSLACTPLSNLLGWRELLKRSRTLGLYAFMVAFIHILIFLDLDNGLAWDFFAQTIVAEAVHPLRDGDLPDAHPAGGHLIRYLEGAPGQELEAAASARVSDRPRGRAALRPLEEGRSSFACRAISFAR